LKNTDCSTSVDEKQENISSRYDNKDNGGEKYINEERERINRAIEEYNMGFLGYSKASWRDWGGKIVLVSFIGMIFTLQQTSCAIGSISCTTFFFYTMLVGFLMNLTNS
jgi:hypothetical protein